MSQCSDPEIGDLLHAYEMGGLPEEDLRKFEIHLLSCDYCFEHVKEFMPESALLHLDDEVKDPIIKAAMAEAESPESLPRKVWKYLWPDTPMLFKPALSHALILILLFPLAYGIMKWPKPEIGPVQVAFLPSDRSIEMKTLQMSKDRDAMLWFKLENVIGGESYLFEVEALENGETISSFQDHVLSDDDQILFWISFPHALMKPGKYRIKVIDPRTEPPQLKQELFFKIDK